MITKVDPLIDILEELPIPQKSLQIFLEYLCSQTGEYSSLKEVAVSFDLSKQRVHQVVERFCTAVSMKYKHNGVLERVIAPVTKTLSRYKGAIRIERFVDEHREKTGLGDVEIRRYLRFAEITSKQIVLDSSLDMFWEIRSRCLKCRSFKEYLITYKELVPEILERIDQDCILQKCPFRGDRLFDFGQLIYHSPFHQASTENQQIEAKVAPINNKASYDELIHSTRASLNNTQIELLNFMCKNGCKISQTKMAAYCGIKKIDLNSTFLETNASFFKETGAELVTYNATEERWELDDAVLALSSNGKICEPERDMQGTLGESKHDEATLTEDNQARNILNLHMEMLANTLSKSNQSYKFYWAESLFYFIKQKRTSVSFQEMAACMVAHAWDDVLIRKYAFKSTDVIPKIAKRAYVFTELKRESSILEKIEHLNELLSKQECFVLTRCAPSYFLISYELLELNTKDHSSKPHDESIYMQHLYNYDINSVTFNDTLCGYLTKYIEELLKKVVEMKSVYFTKIAAVTD